MPVTLVKLPDDPVILCTFEGHITRDDLRNIRNTSIELIEGGPARVYRIHDTRKMALNFGDLVVLLAEAATTRHDPGGVGLDPRFVDMAITTRDTLVHFGVKSMSQKHYGGIDISVYDDLDKALAYARENPLP